MADYKISDKGLRMLTNFEAMVTHVYEDQGGVPTVCVGHVVRPEDHKWIDDGVTADECRTILSRDVGRFEQAISHLVTVQISQPMVDALVSLVFNIGEMQFATSSVLRLVNEGRFSEAADAFLLWRYVKVQQKDGTWVKKPILLGRREAEAALFRSGILEATIGAKPDDLPLEAILGKVAALQFSTADLLDPDSPLPANDDDGGGDLTDSEGRLVCLPPSEEEPAEAA